MALLTPKMSLRLWEQLNDPYSHEQLADNFSKLDFHDHSPGRGNQIPTEGLFDGSVTGAKIASSVFGWRSVLTARGQVGQSFAANTYVVTNFMGAPALNLASGTPGAQFAHISPNDHAILGKTTEWRIRVSLICNAVAPGVNFTWALQPITSVSGSANGTITAVLGSAVGNTVFLSTPAASARLYSVSTTFSLTTADFYTPTFTNSGTTAANSTGIFYYELQVRNV